MQVTKCFFQKYGASGTIQVHDTLCVMALNVINEKIYTFLWFWFVIMAVANVAGLLWRLLTLALFSRSGQFNRVRLVRRAAAFPPKCERRTQMSFGLPHSAPGRLGTRSSTRSAAVGMAI